MVLGFIVVLGYGMEYVWYVGEVVGLDLFGGDYCDWCGFFYLCVWNV